MELVSNKYLGSCSESCGDFLIFHTDYRWRTGVVLPVFIPAVVDGEVATHKRGYDIIWAQETCLCTELYDKVSDFFRSKGREYKGKISFYFTLAWTSFLQGK